MCKKKKWAQASLKNIIYKMCLEIIYLIYMYKEDLALDNQQWLICHKTQPHQTTKRWVVVLGMTLNCIQWKGSFKYYWSHNLVSLKGNEKFHFYGTIRCYSTYSRYTLLHLVPFSKNKIFFRNSNKSMLCFHR